MSFIDRSRGTGWHRYFSCTASRCIHRCYPAGVYLFTYFCDRALLFPPVNPASIFPRINARSCSRLSPLTSLATLQKSSLVAMKMEDVVTDLLHSYVLICHRYPLSCRYTKVCMMRRIQNYSPGECRSEHVCVPGHGPEMTCNLLSGTPRVSLNFLRCRATL